MVYVCLNRPTVYIVNCIIDVNNIVDPKYRKIKIWLTWSIVLASKSHHNDWSNDFLVVHIEYKRDSLISLLLCFWFWNAIFFLLLSSVCLGGFLVICLLLCQFIVIWKNHFTSIEFSSMIYCHSLTVSAGDLSMLKEVQNCVGI